MSNNYWNTCQSEQSRLQGHGSKNQACEVSCLWYLHSSKDLNSFWKYVRRTSDDVGKMNSLSTSETAKLLSMRTIQVENHLSNLLTNLKNSNEFKKLVLK